MKLRHHAFLDEARVREAIAAAERETSAPIAVSVAPHFFGDVRKTAERAFERLGLTKAPHRNGVLFFVVPARRTFVLFGDAAAHEALGQATWDTIVAGVETHFRNGHPTAGIVHGVEAVGRALARHFPA
ncbi:MAG: TPM domain-containing protein [Candidatus Eremiobacteraeota bacterium]|nr:TPM domain-containing protein [Candidatus Eremiobacteraeota bacterium]